MTLSDWVLKLGPKGCWSAWIFCQMFCIFCIHSMFYNKSCSSERQEMIIDKIKMKAANFFTFTQYLFFIGFFCPDQLGWISISVSISRCFKEKNKAYFFQHWLVVDQLGAGQIHFALWTNTFSNLDNTFGILDKYMDIGQYKFQHWLVVVTIGALLPQLWVTNATKCYTKCIKNAIKSQWKCNRMQ